MKKVFSAFVSVILAFAVSLEVFAITIDGQIGVAEWDNIEAEDFVKSTSGCNIKNFIYQYYIDERNDTVSLAFRTIEKSAIENFENCAFEIVIDNGFTILVTPEREKYNSEYFDVNSAVVLAGGQMVSCEISILFKKGLGEKLSFTVSAYDSFGDSSRDYELNFSFEENDISEDDSTQSKTTKEKAVKEKTTKEKSSKASKKSSKSSKYVTVKSSKKNSKENSYEEYETANEEDYYEDAEEDAQAINQDENAEKSNDGAIILKTLAVTIAVLALGSIVFTVKKNKKI